MYNMWRFLVYQGEPCNGLQKTGAEQGRHKSWLSNAMADLRNQYYVGELRQSGS